MMNVLVCIVWVFPTVKWKKDLFVFASFYANVNKVESPFEIQKFVREVESGDYNSFFRRLQSFFADTTYEVIRDQELHYENVLFIVLNWSASTSTWNIIRVTGALTLSCGLINSSI